MSYFKYGSKNIYYHETGTGEPVIFLHGNTASSKMFDLITPLYQNDFTVILIDFLGNGRSDRTEHFADDIWFDEGQQTIALIEHLGCGRVHLVGTSGGAWAALHAALERPDLIHKVVADSFDGRTLHQGFIEDLVKDREFAKNDPQVHLFYEWWQGSDWAEVVERDTQALMRYDQGDKSLFRKPLSQLQVPLLLMGSKADDMVRKNLAEEYEAILQEVQSGEMKLFEEGGHPALQSNAEEAAGIIRRFLNK